MSYDDYDWDDGRDYDYDDWDSHYDYDSYDSDEDVDVTLSFNLKEALELVLSHMLSYMEDVEKDTITSFVHNIMRYFHTCCQEINRGKRNPIAFIKNDMLNINSDMPWNVLWSNRDYDSCEEVDEEMASCLEHYFLNNVHVPVGNSLRNFKHQNSDYDEKNFGNIRIRKGKANVAPVINYIIDNVRDGTIRVDCETDDLEEIAREGIDDWNDYNRSRNAAADAYFHG